MLKRQMDLILTVFALIALSPVLLGVALLLYLTQGRPLFFTQPRVGHKGHIFHLYKFRTMKPIMAGENPHGMERLTKFGKIIRSLSLDELPSLINVLKGEMSLVGPRPLLVHYLERYSPNQMKRHDVLPGLTGWAQVNGRNTLSWEDKFKYDVWYAEHASFWLDVKIIYLTFKILIWRSGINANKTDVAEEFDPGLYVLGSGGHAKVVIATIEACGHKVMGLFDDDPRTHGKKILGVPVLGSIADVKNYPVKKAVIGIGSNEVRAKIASEYSLNWITLVHPEALIHPTVKIGKGTVVFAKVVIQPDSVIGDHAIVNTGAIVEHDCHVGNLTHLCPGVVLAGGVGVGESCLIGTGTKVIPGKKIGQYCTLGAGSVVTKDIPEFSLAVGVPAEIKKTTLTHIQRKKA